MQAHRICIMCIEELSVIIDTFGVKGFMKVFKDLFDLHNMQLEQLLKYYGKLFYSVSSSISFQNPVELGELSENKRNFNIK